VSEADLLQAVRDLCGYMGLSVYHTHDSRRSEPGFPDIVAAGPGGLLLRELKADKGKVSPEQHRWLSVLRSAGADAGVWRPEQLRDGTVERELRGLR
jgi:hypothetical protein